MGRYLERAEFLCRLLRLQTEALVDRPIREIHVGWFRIYGGIDREPPAAAWKCWTTMSLRWRIPTPWPTT